jgi:hypothetical protein
MGITKQLRKLIGKKSKVSTTPEELKIIADVKMVKKIWPSGTWTLHTSKIFSAEQEGADMDNLVQGDLIYVHAYESTEYNESALRYGLTLNRERLMQAVDPVPHDWLPSAHAYTEWFVTQPGRGGRGTYLTYVLGRLRSMGKLKA